LIARVCLLAAFALAGLAPAAEPDSIEALREHVEVLSAPGMEGRLVGSDGEGRAAKYLASELRRLGARPMPGANGFEQRFEFTAGAEDTGSSLRLSAGDDAEPVIWDGVKDVRALSYSDDGSVSGEVVFAGYGLSLPEGDDLDYDSFAGLDVTDKIVVVLRYFPEDTEGDTRAALAQYAGLRYKAMQARDRGARALLVVTGPRSPNAGKTIEMSFDAELSGSGLVAASVSGSVGERLFEQVAGKTLEQAQLALDSGDPHVAGFAIPGIELTLDVSVRRVRRQGRNVVGYLPATGDGGRPVGAKPFLVLGAHYDHLGFGKHGNSLARKGEEGEIHCGADDNASGVAAVLAVAARLSAEPHSHGIVFGLWSGEELGLLGSSGFVNGKHVTPERIAAYLNFDMVGRMKDNRLNLQAVGSSSVWPQLIEKANVAAGFDVRMQEDPYLPTDALVFYQAGVPTLAFFTGSHDDYHRPTDVADRLNYEDLQRVAGFATTLVLRLDRLEEPPDYVEVEATPQKGGDRDSLRAYTGTIPDYATEVEGLRLSGVASGGPADRAGLREGDVIVEFAGREIGNIYDYTYALDTVKIDQPVKVICIRDGERLEFTITPTPRP
jgi:hypothetical protein